jgi:hypothetical protein
MRQTILDRIEFDATPVGEPRNLTLWVENDTLIVRFVDPDGASRRLGGILFLTGHRTPQDISWQLNAHRVTVAGPTGWTVTHSPRGHRAYRVGNGFVEWQADPNEAVLIDSIESREDFAFAPANNVGSVALTRLHRVLGGVPAAVSMLLRYALIPAIGLFLLVVGLGRWMHSGGLPNRLSLSRRQPLGIVGLGILVSVASSQYPPLLLLGLLYLIIGIIGYGFQTTNKSASIRHLSGAAGIGIIVSLLGWLSIFPTFLILSQIVTSVFLLGAIAFALPFGAFASPPHRYGGGLLLATTYALAVVLFTAPSFSVAESDLFVAFVFIMAILVFLAGVPLAHLGASLSQ